MKLWFDLQWVRDIGAKYPWLARFAEMTVYSVVTTAAVQLLKVIDAMLSALSGTDPIIWRDIILNFDWRVVAAVVVFQVQAALGKFIRERRRVDEGTKPADHKNDDTGV